jgi:hypothetical protein
VFKTSCTVSVDGGAVVSGLLGLVEASWGLEVLSTMLDAVIGKAGDAVIGKAGAEVADC